MKSTAAAACFAFVLCSAARGAPPAPSNALVNAVLACKAEEEAQARLRCYDDTVASLSQATTAGSLVVIDREDVRQTRRSLFGFTLPKLPFFKGDDSQDDQAEEIEAKVKSARNLGYDKWLIVLDNDAAWQTTEAMTRQSDPRPGQSVKIKKGTLGGYFLSIDGKASLRAMRIR